jgi:hypothetical protein
MAPGLPMHHKSDQALFLRSDCCLRLLVSPASTLVRQILAA